VDWSACTGLLDWRTGWDYTVATLSKSIHGFNKIFKMSHSAPYFGGGFSYTGTPIAE